MKSEARLKLKRLLHTLAPEDVSELNAFDIERLKKKMPDLYASMQSLVARMEKNMKETTARHEKMISDLRASHDARMTDGFSKLKESLDAAMKDMGKKHEKIANDSSLHRGKIDQIIEEMKDDIKVSYSKMGGATMPMFTQTVTTTLDTGASYFLSPSVLSSELEVYVGGGRVFAENGDFTTSGPAGNYVNYITFLDGTADNIASGAIINIKAKY